MNMFADVTQDIQIQDEERDTLGGFQVPDSGAYKAVVKVAYGSVATSGAKAINVIFTLENGTEHREVLYVTAGKAKGGNNFYVNSKGEKKYLPGFKMAESLCEVATGKPLAQQKVEEKVLNLYNPEAKKEVPTTVPVLMDMLNKPVVIGLIKKLENKRVKTASGEYVDTPESRELAELDKIFTESGMTITETKGENPQASFIGKWREKWDGHIRDVRTIKDGQAPATNTGGGFVSAPQGQHAQPAQAAAPAQSASVQSLFS